MLRPLHSLSFAIAFVLLLITASADIAAGNLWNGPKIVIVTNSLGKRVYNASHRLRKSNSNKAVISNNRFDNSITTSTGATIICPGSSLTLTANPSPSGATYQWMQDGNPIAINGTSSTYNASAAGTYFVKVITAGTTVDYPPITLTVGVNPVASFTHTADQGCSSSPIGFTSTTPGSNLTYAWDFGDPNSGANNTSTLVNPNHKFIGTPGDTSLTYTVRLTVTNSDGCSNSITQTIAVKQRPSTQLGNATEYNGEYYFTGCGNGPTSMTFGNVAASQSTNTSYIIKWGDGTTDFTASSFNAATHTYAIGTYNLSFIVTGANGCIDTAHYKVFIGSNPAVGLGNPGNTSICTGSSLTFPVTNTQSNPPGTTYTVLFNDGSAPKVYTSPPDTIIHYFNRSSCGAVGGAYPNSFSATIIASNPCSSSQAVVTPIYVSQKAQASFSANKTVTCAGNTITFSNTGLGNNVVNANCTASKFVWTISPATGWATTASALGNDFGQTNSSSWQSGQNSLPVQFTVAGTYTIKLKIGNTNCGSDEITKTVCINPAPTASFTTDVTAGCGPLTVTTANTSPLPTCGNNTYQWSVSPSSGVVYTNGTNSASASPVVIFNNAGNYNLSLITINSNGDCSSAAAIKTINVIAKPTVSSINMASSLCEGLTSAPTATVSSSDTPTYLWTFGGGSPATSTSLVPGTITYSSPGNYTTTLAVTNSCGTTTVTKTISVTARPTMTQPGNGQFCAGDPSGIISFTGSLGATFTWTNNNTAIGLGASGTGNIPSFTTRNTTNAPIVATITVTPSNGCTGTPMTFTITVNAKPTTATTGSDTQTCGTTFQLNSNTPTIGTGIWAQTTGPAATISDVNAPNATLSNLTKGTRYQWTWTISNGSGCPPSAKTFTLDVLSDIVNTIKSDVTAVCPGQSVHLTTDILSGGDVPTTLPASYSYIWESSPDGINNWTPINAANAASLTTIPNSTISYRRKVRSFNQCEVISNVITIGLNAGAPAANAGSPISICNQTQAQLNGNDPGVNFTGTWTDDATGSALTFSPDAHTYNATVGGLTPGQIYHLTWTITSVSCGATTSRLTVTDLLPLTNSIAPSAATICYGQNTTIGGTSQGGTGSYIYSWESSTDQNTWSVMIGQANANLNISPTQNTYYRRTVISGTCNQVSNAVQIIVLPPIANNTVSASQQVCIGQSVSQLNGSLPTGGDSVNYAYQWQQSIDNVNWTSIASATGQNYQPVSVNQSIYYRRLATSSLCTGAQQSTSASVKITVNPNAKAEFTASSTAGCIPFDLRRVITSIPHDDLNSTYTWFANGLMIGNGSAFPGYTINTDGTQVVIKLVTVSKFGCDTNSMSKTFTTTQLVSALFTKDQIKGCGPLITHFTNTSNPLGSANYSWNFGNGSTSSLAQPPPVTFQPNPFGRDTTYIITLKAITTCGISTFKDSVTVRSKPKAIFTPDKTTGCSPFTINITNQSRGLPNNYTFSFGNGDKITRSDNQAIQYVYTTTKTDTLTLKLVAENECGKDSSSYRIVVYPNTVQANLVVNGDNKSGCAPFTVKFDNNSTGANTFSYDFGDGTTATTSSAPETISHTFTKGGTYSVKMTASNGCSTQSTIQTITVLAAPQVAFAMNQLQYCVKELALFTNQTEDITAYNYVWDFGDGKTSNDVNPQHSYVSAGTYKVTLTAIQTAADGTLCSKTTTQIVTILLPPVATFSSNASTLNCAPFNYIVASTPGSASGASWQFGDPGSVDNAAAGFTANHLYTKAGIYKVQLLVYNQNGCADTSFQVVKITESPQPRFVTADTVLCGNAASISFKNNTTYGGSDPVSYKWFINDIQVSTQKDLSYTFNVPSGAVQPYIYKVKLQASSTIGCSDTEIHTMRFNPLPVAKFSVPSNISCAPFALAINNTSQYADQFQWFLDGQLVSTDKIPAGIVLKVPNKTYILKLVAANIYGCQQDQFSVTLSTYPKPTAAFSLTDSVSCNGKLEVNVTNKTTGAVSYIWNFGDGSPEQTGLTPSHTYGVPGAYSLSLIASNGTCRDTIIHHIQIAATPKASFVASVLKGCTTVTTTFQNLSVNSNSFLWDFGDGTFSTSKNPTHTYTYVKSPFTVKLSVIGDYGCTDETVLVNYITVTAPPVVDFVAVPDSVIKIPDHTFTFKNNTTGAVSKYNWDFGDGKISTDKEPTHTYADAGTFQVRLTAINPDGCSSFRIRTVKVDNVQQYLYVPNAFEPGSAKSELRTFNVRALGLKTYSLRIFNKWGQLLYETTALDDRGVPTNGWNGEMQGQLAPLGVYIWRITAFFLDGTEWRGMKYKNSDTPSKTGILHLIR